MTTRKQLPDYGVEVGPIAPYPGLSAREPYVVGFLEGGDRYGNYWKVTNNNAADVKKFKFFRLKSKAQRYADKLNGK